MLKKITKSGGFNDSERALARLCDESFLELWSYPSLWKPEGRKTPDGVGTELCDVLLVFGDAIVLFSDKDIKFHADIDVNVAWKRWRKKAIDASKKQLFGAMKWLQERPADLFLDPRCTQPFPFIDASTKYRFHLVAVTRNTMEAAARHFGMNSSGSLVQMSLDVYPEPELPFIVRDDRAEHYVHVVDEQSLRLVLEELDTAPDFIKYLRDKERAVRRQGFRFIPGEEDFLGSYMLHAGPLVEGPFDELVAKATKDVGFIQLAEDGWAQYVNSGTRAQRRQINRESYFWDELIARFCEAILGGFAPNPLGASSVMHEMATRRLASETRQSRIVISRAYQTKVQDTPRHIRTSRLFRSPTDKKHMIVLLLVPRAQGQTLDEHRELRLNMMHAYGFAAKVRFPDVIDITVIGTEPGIGDIRSEDVLALRIPELTAEERAIAMEIMKDANVLNDIWHDKLLSQRAASRSYAKPSKPVRRVLRVPGRNELCPCGSGLKYKKCCLGRVEEAGSIHGFKFPRG
jgi:hypothetical protein